MNRADEYIQWTKDNPTLVCDKVKKAIARYEAMKAKCNKRNSTIYFDEVEPENVIAFAENYMKMYNRGALENLKVYNFQAFIIYAIYGFKYKSNNKRVVRKAIISMAKKNGKSSFASIFILYDLYSRNNAKIYLAALNKEQTNNVFQPVQTILLNSPELLNEVEISKKQKSVVHKANAGFINTLSKGAESKQGVKVTLAIIDEYYLYKDDELYSILSYGTRGEDEPLILTITTAGSKKNSPYWYEYDRCSKILDGILEDDSTFFISFELDEKDEPTTKKNLNKANPLLVDGFLTLKDDFDGDITEVKQKPYKLSSFTQFTCNRWTDNIITGWIPTNKWEMVMRPVPNDEYLNNLPSCLGLDLSQVWDFTSLSQIYFDEPKNLYYQKHWFFIPEETIEERLQENINIKQWADDGIITTSQGSVINYNQVAEIINKRIEIGNVLATTYDPALFKELKPYLNDESVFIPFTQSLDTMNSPSKLWEKAILEKQIVDNNPVMRWMVSCATVKPTADCKIRPIKPDLRTSKQRIDGVITSIIAFDWIKNLKDNVEQKSKYTFEQLMNL